MSDARAIRKNGEKTVRATVKAMAAAQQQWEGEHGVGQAPTATATVPAQPGAAGLQPPHLVKDMLSQAVFYPAHDTRRESPGYTAIRKQMVEVEDKECLVCGVRNSTLGDPAQNLFGAKQLETHHWIVEWALANAVDLTKFNNHIVGSMRQHPQHDRMYDQDFTQQQMLDWIDHGRDNLKVLCDVHHRHKYVGIHAISYPIWGPQDILMPGFGAQVKG